MNKEIIKKEFHGGQLVYSKKHKKNIHILMAHHTQEYGSKPTLDHYIFVDGTTAQPDEVEDAQ